MKSEQVSPQGGFYVTIATTAGSTTKRVEGDLLTVGRADDCHLTISHETLSRRHMSIMVKDGGCYVEDHGSSNGTFINGKRVRTHSPIRVLPEDQITMGQAGVRLAVSTEPVVRKEGTPPIPGEPAAAEDTIVTSTSVHRHEARKAHVPVQAKPKEESREQAEVLLQDAQKKAALMIQEAEIEAERRVEDIYRRAHETQAKMDEVYQRRMNEAYRASEQIYQKAHEESQKILDVARQRSSEIRLQAENFVSELRKKTEDDCERMLEEAQQTARDLKEQRLLEAEDLIKRKEEEVISRARESMNDRVARMEEDLAKNASRHRADLDRELDDRRAQFENENKSTLEAIAELKGEVQQLADLKTREEALLAEVEGTLREKTDEATALKAEVEDAKKAVVRFNQELCDVRTEIDRVNRDREAGEKHLKMGRESLAKLNEEIRSTQAKVKGAQEQAVGDLGQVRAKLEDDKAKLVKQEQTRFEELKLQTTRKVRELEEKMVEELHLKQERLAREITLVVETYVRRNPNGLSAGVKAFQEEITGLLKKQIVTLSTDESAKTKQASLIQLKRRQKMAVGFVGLVAGASLSLVSEQVYFNMRNEASPLQRRVAAAQEERRQDLEQRKFDPPVSRGYKATYVDNVVYTDSFADTYLSDGFQKALLKGLTPYMLKTWKVDEDKVIQVLGISSALVKELFKKRQNIHPDFVTQSLDKMRQDETDALARLRTLLGSQVRLESYKKFEGQFFDSFHRAPADTDEGEE